MEEVRSAVGLPPTSRAKQGRRLTGESKASTAGGSPSKQPPTNLHPRLSSLDLQPSTLNPQLSTLNSTQLRSLLSLERRSVPLLSTLPLARSPLSATVSYRSARAKSGLPLHTSRRLPAEVVISNSPRISFLRPGRGNFLWFLRFTHPSFFDPLFHFRVPEGICLPRLVDPILRSRVRAIPPHLRPSSLSLPPPPHHLYISRNTPLQQNSSCLPFHNPSIRPVTVWSRFSFGLFYGWKWNPEGRS